MFQLFSAMRTTPVRSIGLTLAAMLCFVAFKPDWAKAGTTAFFSSSQTTNLVAEGATWNTIGTEGYLFNLTLDKLFTGGIGLTNPIGRNLRIKWPEGLEAQAVTAGPATGGAKLVISRQDGQLFSIAAFTFELLANTGGAGAALEIMPLLNGEDGLPDPRMYNATGYYGSSFTYNTPELVGFDAYKLTLYVDFALTRLTVVDETIPPPTLDIATAVGGTIQLSWPTNNLGYTLESAPTPASITWTPVTNAVITQVDVFVVEVQSDTTEKFFRLRK